MYSGIRAYSTLNDEPHGPIDSSFCYTVFQESGSWRFASDQVPSGRSVFFEVELDTAQNLGFDTTTVYTLEAFVSFFNAASEQWSAHMQVSMEDSSGTDTVQVDRELSFPSSSRACFVTQLISGQRLSDLTFEYRSNGGQQNFYTGGSSYFEPTWYSQIVPQTTSDEELSQWYPHVFRYWHEIYPTADSISYTEVVPAGNPTDSVMIEWVVPVYTEVHFQDHTGVRGGLVNGSDSIRHGLELVLQGSICLGNIVEVGWENDNKLVIDGGEVLLHGETSCNVFGRGGGLHVRSGTSFRYGRNGVGMMVLRTGADISIEPGAELLIDGHVEMYEYGTDPEPQQLYMELPHGASLSFSENAVLSNAYSKDGTMRLNVLMKGGKVDLSELSATERDLVNLIYPPVSARPGENLALFPNPVYDQLNIEWNAENAGLPVHVEVFNASGQLMMHQELKTYAGGLNLFPVNTRRLASGVHVVVISDASGRKLTRDLFIKH